MAQKATADGGDESANDQTDAAEHQASDLETIVVDADDVIEAMRRNWRDEDEQRSHVLRISTPLEGTKEASLHVDEAHTWYPPEMFETPIHIGPTAFVVGHDQGSRHPDWRNEWSFPSMAEERSLFRDEFDARDENGENRPLTDDEQDEWDEWWDTVVEMWEDRVRHALDAVDEITLTDLAADGTRVRTTVDVEITDE